MLSEIKERIETIRKSKGGFESSDSIPSFTNDEEFKEFVVKAYSQ